MSARVVYVELPAPDFARTTSFYEEVFGWSVTRSSLEEGDYGMFVAGVGEGALSGGFRPSLPVASEGGPLLYLHVESIGATLAAVEAAGGATLRGAFAVGGAHGYAAEFRDPCGNLLGLWCSHPD